MQNWEFPPLPDWFWYPIVLAYGAIVGSFLNVLIHRMPLGMSVTSPPSHCPRCNHYLGFWDNIPLLSFLALGARCRYCRTPISWRYFGVELLTAALWVVLYHRLATDTGISWANFIAHALFASILVAVIFIDLDHFIIPDELNAAGVALGLGRDVICLALAWQAGPWWFDDVRPRFLYFGWLPVSIAGALVYGGLLFLVSFLGFLYYARDEGEPLAATARRFFVYDEEEGAEEAETDGAASPGEGTGIDDDAAGVADEGEEDEGEPVRLRFSPAFLTGASALLLAPVIRGWALPVALLPPLAFTLLARRPGEPLGGVVARFFRSDDQAGAADAPSSSTPAPAPESGAGAGGEADLGVVVAGSPDAASEAAAEADRFAREAETGAHGGMGLGDVKLALAIGALLGPGLALLSLFAATAAGAVTGITLARLHGKGLRIGIPFGPFMAFGAVLMMLYGPDLVAWYLRLLAPAR